MVNFVLLYTGGKAGATEVEQKKVLQDWNTWFGKLGTSLVDGGHSFGPKIKFVERDGTVRDAPVDGCDLASGYTIIKADSLNRAAELAKGCPVLHDGGKISIYETRAM
jgi:hypothetical protein